MTFARLSWPAHSDEACLRLNCLTLDTVKNTLTSICHHAPPIRLRHIDAIEMRFDCLIFFRLVDIYREFTASDVSSVSFSGIPVLSDSTSPLVPPGCIPMPSFTYLDDALSTDFGLQSDSYIAYDISGLESLLVDQYVLLVYLLVHSYLFI